MSRLTKKSKSSAKLEAVCARNSLSKQMLHPHDAFEKKLREGAFIILVLAAIFLLVSLVTYNAGDPGWSRTGYVGNIANAAGKVGAWFADFMLYLFGYLAYLFPAMIAYSGMLFLNNSKQNNDSSNAVVWLIKGTGFLCALIGGCGLASLHFHSELRFLPDFSGGILGQLLHEKFAENLNQLGTTLLFLAAFLVGITLATGLSWLIVADQLGRFTLRVSKFICYGVMLIVKNIFGGCYSFVRRIRAYRISQHKFITPVMQAAKYNQVDVLPNNEIADRLPEVVANTVAAVVPITVSAANVVKNKKTTVIAKKTDKQKNIVIDLPPVELLDEPNEPDIIQYSAENLARLSKEVEEKLLDFGIKVKVAAIYPGPVITRFEMHLAPGVKVSKITALSKDLARSLSVVSVRVVEVIAGKSVVGLEIPNNNREIVRLRDLIESAPYRQSRVPLTLALGKDIAGDSVIVNLAKMPHLLVAGTTGSGKSVCINAMLLSILYKATPAQARLILIDPKMLELSIYEGIPHLLTPVVTDMKDAACALGWCVAEMERRYQLLATVGVRNLEGYNHKVLQGLAKGKPITDPFWQPVEGEEPPQLETLPVIVVVVDEFADMIMVVGKKVEELIARIAQKARAAGIHLILATQRPSVDVITGLIKANIPTRIAFQVSSKIDSRTILDQQGAEQLLGYGDMLYLAPGTGIPTRIHGAFVSDDEVHAVVRALKEENPVPNYIDNIGIGVNKTFFNYDNVYYDSNGENDDEQDPLYDEAVFIVTKSRRASISNLQRRLKIGYNRAARLIDTMEAVGIVSAMQAKGGREVLVSAPVDNE